ncbi:MAG: polysaccharide pyruvyl transferase family protein [Ruminococcus sp.]|nr:polysaccharide pyruvyl transferase family protein [Ruminococcus sp.]
MKKVGILTFHRALNYGAVLQGYALQKTLTKLGADCDIVDYICPKITTDYKPFRIYKNDLLKSFAKSCVMFRRRAIRAKSFQSFFNNLIVKSKKEYTPDNISDAKDDYDLFIAGSDQVWSPRCVGFDPAYFLTFARDEQKYSYAASFAIPDLPEEQIPEYKKRLAGFQSFSVREQSGEKLVKELTGREAVTHLDPSLLLSADEWSKIAVRKLNQPYILVFSANPPVSMVAFAKKLSKEKNLPVYYINDAPHPNKDGINYILAPTVEEFVGYFKNAEYVVTNSFHGTAFSVIFNRNLFVEFKNTAGRNIRSEGLLTKLGINREIVDGNAVETKINWNEVNRKLAEETQSSLEYLRNIIE